nr:MAG TPA: hypothetical protein [Caudoviricetes sp.]DAW48077.1 MAG TPA: hypothetical protein [Caudoviricetes sp.]
MPSITFPYVYLHSYVATSDIFPSSIPMKTQGSF